MSRTTTKFKVFEIKILRNYFINRTVFHNTDKQLQQNNLTLVYIVNRRTVLRLLTMFTISTENPPIAIIVRSIPRIMEAMAN